MTSASSQLSKTLRRMLVRTQALVEAGVIEQPRWLDAVTRWVSTPLNWPKPPRCPVFNLCHARPAAVGRAPVFWTQAILYMLSGRDEEE